MRTLAINRRVREGGYSAWQFGSLSRDDALAQAHDVVRDGEQREAVIAVGLVVGRHVIARVVGQQREPFVELPRVEQRRPRGRANPRPRRARRIGHRLFTRRLHQLAPAPPEHAQMALVGVELLVVPSPCRATASFHGTSRHARIALLHRLQRRDIVGRREAAGPVEREERVAAGARAGPRSPRPVPSAHAVTCIRSGATGIEVRTVTDEPSLITRFGKITRLRLVSATRAARASPSRATSSARIASISAFASSP